MQVYNPTRLDISQDYNLRNYLIPAGQTKVVMDDAGEHLIRKCKMFGLVSLEYTEKEEQEFGSIQAFKKFKAKEGLSNLVSSLEERMRQEAYGIKESIEKNASPEIAMSFKVKEFEAQIIDVKNQIAEIAGSDPKMNPVASDLQMIKHEVDPVKVRRKPGRRTGFKMPKKEISINETPAVEVSLGA